MKPVLIAALLCVQPALVAAQPLPAAPVQSRLLGVELPAGATISRNGIYRWAARTSLRLDADSAGMQLGEALEVLRIPLAAPAQAQLIALIQSGGWTVTMHQSDPTWGIAERAGTTLMVQFTDSRRDRWVYVAAVDTRVRSPEVAVTGATPPAAQAPTPVSAPTLAPETVPARSATVTTPEPTPRPTSMSASASRATSSEHLPTGDTPDRYPGSVGWLPSGRGAPIPTARLVTGRPQGLWWHYQVKSATQLSPFMMVFLPDGTMAHLPRPGSGTQVDIAQQRERHGSEYVGTFRVTGNEITTSINNYTRTEPFSTGTNTGEEWFEIGGGRHYPLARASARGLVGRWRGDGQSYVFRADGTFESGYITNNSEFTATQSGRGTWQLDGYLLGFTLADGSLYIDLSGMTNGFLVIGSIVYTRQ